LELRAKNVRYIENITRIRKPVICNGISPKFNGFKTQGFLPLKEIYRR
jgi:hypothetical protein